MQYDRQSLLSIQWLCLVMHFCSQHSASQVPPSRTTIDVILFYVRSRARNLWQWSKNCINNHPKTPALVELLVAPRSFSPFQPGVERWQHWSWTFARPEHYLFTSLLTDSKNIVIKMASLFSQRFECSFWRLSITQRRSITRHQTATYELWTLMHPFLWTTDEVCIVGVPPNLHCNWKGLSGVEIRQECGIKLSYMNRTEPGGSVKKQSCDFGFWIEKRIGVTRDSTP